MYESNTSRLHPSAESILHLSSQPNRITNVNLYCRLTSGFSCIVRTGFMFSRQVSL